MDLQADLQLVDSPADPSDQQVARWLAHIRALARDIGPRGSTSEEERRAAEYCAGEYRRIGLKPRIEEFTSASSLFRIHLYVAVTMLIAFAIYPLDGRLSAGIAVALAAVAMYSEIMELLFLNNPMRRLLPRAQSQNVLAILEPPEDHRQDLILMGHLDTNRTAAFFQSNTAIILWRVASSIVFFSFVTQIFVYVAGLMTQWSAVWPGLSAHSVFGALLLSGLMVEAERAPFTHGANDNASAAGLVLALAERLKDSPLRHTRVWFVNTGCEEVKHYGAIHFFHRHRADLVNPRAVIFEMLGRDTVGWLVKESTVGVFTTYASPEMVALAEEVAGEHPDLGAHPTWVGGGHTEMADAVRFGVPAITLIGLDECGTGFDYRGAELYWHKKGDVFENILPDVLARNYAFAWEYVQALDAKAG